MLISVNWLKKYVDLSDVSTDELVNLIGSRLVEVEEEIDLSEKYKGIKIVEVVSAEKLEGSDHLTICMVNDGGSKLVQVVCGAPNVRAGILAVWLAPGVVLPETYNKDQLILEKRKIMGVESSGMLAAMDELDLGTDHAGILEINPESAKPGDSFAEIFGLNDIILDIENKSLTHRPDCFGIIGFAREVAGVLGKKFDEPEIFKKNKFNFINETGIKVEIADAELCPRYSVAVIDNAHEKNSKYLTSMQIDLAKSGVRPIDRIVDITNYLMLLTGQPLHAFDYDKLIKVGGEKEAKIIIRQAKKNEKLELLDGKTITCDEKDILITSNDKPVALAGAMGGANTAIDEKTNRIVIESATFNLYNLRGTQFRHGIFSEAVTRFTKGQPAGLTMPVLEEAIDMIGGKIEVVKDTYPKPIKSKKIDVNIEKINGTLGTNYDFNEMIICLENVGFKVKLIDDYFQVESPWWRTDIHIAEDVIEEIGRLKGYNNISLTVPTKGFVAPKPDKYDAIKKDIRNSLVSMGANELLNYSFVSEDLLKKVGQDPKNSYKIINSISPELQLVRQRLMPSLLEKIYDNQKAGYDKFALFEMNQVFAKDKGMTKENVPVVDTNLALVCFDAKNTDTLYYDAKRMLEELLITFDIEVKIQPRTKSVECEQYYEKKRSADIFVDDKLIGCIAEIKSSVLREMKLQKGIAGLEISIDLLQESINNKKDKKSYKQSQYQDVKRDVTFRINSEIEYIKLENLIHKVLKEQDLWFKCKPASIWQGEDKNTKNISFNLSFASFSKTLKSQEITDIMDKITSEVKKELKGELI